MYLLLAASVLAASFNSVLLHKAKIEGRGSVYTFNLFSALLWCVLLFAVNLGKIELNRQVLLWAVIYGVVQALFIFFKTNAMNSGPVAITTLIGNSSLLISVLFSFFAWGEPIGAIKFVGIVLLLFALFLCTYKKSGDTAFSKKWLIFTAIFFVFCASVGLVFKAFSKTPVKALADDMMFMSAVVMSVSFFVLSLLSGGFKTMKQAGFKIKPFIAFAAASGVLSCLYNRLNIFLSGELDAVIFFPCFNGGVILLSTLLSVITCKEKLTKRQVIGIIIGIIAISIISIF